MGWQVLDNKYSGTGRETREEFSYSILSFGLSSDPSVIALLRKCLKRVVPTIVGHQEAAEILNFAVIIPLPRYVAVLDRIR
jgi:hypothetical protein